MKLQGKLHIFKRRLLQILCYNHFVMDRKWHDGTESC